jgi:hypothetical protein
MTGGNPIHTTDALWISGKHRAFVWDSAPFNRSDTFHRLDILIDKLSITSRKIAVYRTRGTVFYHQNKGDSI